MPFSRQRLLTAVRATCGHSCPSTAILRSLRLLQDEGLLELRRRRGITVAGTPERGDVIQKVRELVEFPRGQGTAVDELVEMIEDVA
jgi:DNA-binding GntR family transcriptional regulator